MDHHGTLVRAFSKTVGVGSNHPGGDLSFVGRSKSC